MSPTIHIAETPEQTAIELADFLYRHISAILKHHDKVTIALSGGSTPRKLFAALAEKYSLHIDWNRMHFFWVDERCVAPNHPDSNYGMTHEALFKRVGISPCNIHRMIGENNPSAETIRYSNEIMMNVALYEGGPVFDIVLLGMGTDGHTASIFPEHLELFEVSELTAVATHPKTMQQRITLTGTVINRAQLIIFHATGKEKAELISTIVNKKIDAMKYPAAHVKSERPIHWYLDRDAACMLGN